ncbi:hypothetical protein GCM10027403_35420 [Arthrobacter tecti]
MPSHVVAVGILVSSAGQVLLCRRSAAKRWYPNVWDFPGGHVEANESPSCALVRELREELDIEAVVPADARWTFSSDVLTAHVYVVERWKGTLHNAAPDEHDELRWVSPGDAASMDLAHPEWLHLIEVTLKRGQE